MKNITPNCLNALSDNIQYALMVKLKINTTDYLRVTNLIGTLHWDGHDWQGVGNLGSINAITNDISLSSKPISLSLSGIPKNNYDILTETTNANYKNNPIVIYYALFKNKENGKGIEIISDPFIVWKGKIDTMSLSISETITIELTAESWLTNWDKPNVYRYTSEDQKRLYPNITDKGFDFIKEAASIEITWGRK